MYDRQFFVVSWGPVGSASAQLPALLVLANRVSLELHRSSLSNFGVGAVRHAGSCREQATPSREDLYPSRKAVEGPAWLLWFGVEVRELDDSVYAVPRALVVVRFLGELLVLPG